MTNRFMFKLLSFLLLVALLASSLFACFDEDVGFTSPYPNNTTQQDGSSTSASGSSSARPTTPTKPSGTTGGGNVNPDDEHYDVDNDGYCDNCSIDVVETLDFYNFNDLHGKLEDTDSQPGIDELTTYLENRVGVDEHTIFLSSGDMWQGGSASNATHGKIITDWMNYLGFEAMALGNHEFDWGQDAIRVNEELAEFPFLAINIYDNATGKRVDYCDASVMIERGGCKIGIIGAIGDCYSSILSEMTKGIHFKVGNELTNLVKAESEKLRGEGADIIVYLLHDGTTYRDLTTDGYYDDSLSSGGYVDLVFEGHSHSYYIFRDDYNVPHLQGGGDNSKGMTHVEVEVNFANGNIEFNTTNYVQHSSCSSLEGSPAIDDLINKYWSEISWIYENLGYNSSFRSSSTIGSTVARLYYEAGIAKWGEEYDIVLAGGSINTRSPYDLSSGYVKYGDLQMLLPFDNALYLCSIKGSDLKSKFINNGDYYVYSKISTSQINDNQTYYIIADSWTALYAWAKCTPIEKYDETTFARDLLAQYIKDGNWE